MPNPDQIPPVDPQEKNELPASEPTPAPELIRITDDEPVIESEAQRQARLSELRSELKGGLGDEEIDSMVEGIGAQKEGPVRDIAAIESDLRRASEESQRILQEQGKEAFEKYVAANEHLIDEYKAAGGQRQNAQIDMGERVGYKGAEQPTQEPQKGEVVSDQDLEKAVRKEMGSEAGLLPHEQAEIVHRAADEIIENVGDVLAFIQDPKAVQRFGNLMAGKMDLPTGAIGMKELDEVLYNSLQEVKQRLPEVRRQLLAEPAIGTVERDLRDSKLQQLANLEQIIDAKSAAAAKPLDLEGISEQELNKAFPGDAKDAMPDATPPTHLNEKGEWDAQGSARAGAPESASSEEQALQSAIERLDAEASEQHARYLELKDAGDLDGAEAAKNRAIELLNQKYGEEDRLKELRDKEATAPGSAPLPGEPELVRITDEDEPMEDGSWKMPAPRFVSTPGENPADKAKESAPQADALPDKFEEEAPQAITDYAEWAKGEISVRDGGDYLNQLQEQMFRETDEDKKLDLAQKISAGEARLNELRAEAQAIANNAATPETTPAGEPPVEPLEAAAAEQAPELKTLRNAKVDAADRLTAWFRGQDKESEFRGKFGNLKQKLYSGINALTKSEWQGRPANQAQAVVKELVAKMIEDPTLDPKAALAEKLAENPKGIENIDPESESARIILDAVRAEHAYKAQRAELVSEFRAGYPAGIDAYNKAHREEDLFKKFVLAELDREQDYREQKLEAERSKAGKLARKAAGVMGRAYKGTFGKLTPAQRIAVGVVVGSAIGIALTGGVAGAGAIIGYRAFRGAGSYLTAKGSASIYEKVAGFFHGTKDSREMAADAAKDLEKAEDKLELFQAIEKATAEAARARSVEAKINRRKGIAAVLAGGAFALGSGYITPGGARQAVESQPGTGNKTDLGQVGDKPKIPGATETEPGTTKPTTAETPDGTTKPSAETQGDAPPDGTKPNVQEAPQGTTKPDVVPDQKAPSAEKFGSEGYKVGRGEGIWHGVKSQVLEYVKTDAASADQLGVKMTPEQFQQLKADALAGKLSPDSAKLLDRVIATSINKNNMMTMGIRQPGEMVFWKPGEGGGTIEFRDPSGAVDKNALYDMRTGKPVSLDNLPSDKPRADVTDATTKPSADRSSVNPVEQPGTKTPANVAESVTEVEIPAGQEWMTGLTEAQVQKALPLFEQFKQATGIDIDAPNGVGDVNVRTLYQNVPAGTQQPVTLMFETPNGRVGITVPAELSRIRGGLVPSDAEMQGNVRNLIKGRIATSGSSVLVEKVNPVVEATPKPSPNVIDLSNRDTIPNPPVNP